MKKKSNIHFLVIGVIVCIFIYLQLKGSNKSEPDTDIYLPVAEKEESGLYLAESTISHGEEVALLNHLSEGRFTVYYFYADW